MQRLSIARSLRLALTGLTLILAAVAALGVSSLYSTRQRYDDQLVATSQLATAAANLASAAIVQQEVQRYARGAGAPPARRSAASAYASAASRALSLARSDPRSEALVRTLLAGSGGNAVLADAAALQSRQTARQAQARARARSDSRRAILAIIVAGALALVAALTLIGLLIRSMRDPLDSLVAATREMTAGDLGQRVTPQGPRELRDLGTAFNTMGDALVQASRRLEDERARLATIVESLGDGLLVTEPGSTIIATANPRAAELVPELRPGVAADGPSSPFPPLESAQAGEVLVDHGERTLAVTASLLSGHDRAPNAVVWTVHDITARARLERAKSEFVATASHELRSPLTSIKGFVELLAGAPAGMSERQKEFVDIILRSTDRLVELVNDLLDVARLEADHVEISRRPIDAAEAVREVAELMGPRIQAKHQHLELELGPALPLAMADPGRLRQIVANLLTNAHLYTPEAGRIKLSGRADEDWVRIEVADSGVGMSQDELDHVFERFFRAGDARANSGTGLGLSIVKSLVDLHQGRLEVSSQPGQGTTFSVLIPAATRGLGVAPALEALRGRRVLVVDDEAEIAQLIADQLAPFDVTATIATGGQAALDQLRTGEFDAITLDIKMPEVDGFDVLRRIRLEPDLMDLPVVFVSVFSDHRDLAGEWVVSKPIDADELREVLGMAVITGRSRVLVVAREKTRAALEPSLKELHIEYQWESSGAAAARACSERRFEVALVDVGLRNPQAVLQALNLRGRRRRRVVILFAEHGQVPPPGITRLGLEVVPIDRAADALVVALRSEPDSDPEAGPEADSHRWLPSPEITGQPASPADQESDEDPDSWLPGPVRPLDG